MNEDENAREVREQAEFRQWARDLNAETLGRMATKTKARTEALIHAAEVRARLARDLAIARRTASE